MLIPDNIPISLRLSRYKQASPERSETLDITQLLTQRNDKITNPLIAAVGAAAIGVKGGAATYARSLVAISKRTKTNQRYARWQGRRRWRADARLTVARAEV